MLLAEYGFVDALYMTVITVSTVGFMEVQPLDLDAKIFTIFLIIFSVTIFGYIISAVTDYISNNKLMEDIKHKKLQKSISKLKGHTIVCGYGRNGKQAVAKLKSYKQDCVLIENDPELIDEIELEGDILYIKGDATDDDALIGAGIENASNCGNHLKFIISQYGNFGNI